mmetsp:Transcript_13087/g.19935  ORF Transcript_13087/g.19935 Transcript_13087/m.19935 type:complete len:546 (-) Transcript_13087:301-1938(-)|eukprot:CAMPEP_0196809984 /NCGR_PEP_ID=MMETSP1362-20130617/9844_1 /TAXON_ID=163516 /ORGANISM="Leptocylindrus danicus, Strain CCMP1856" /LENGTH=545 /DNA_ID=CAMNT_0042184835 /DNA_START=90 /DNA_END=1727 /DNA_ORIENTATION=+
MSGSAKPSDYDLFGADSSSEDEAPAAADNTKASTPANTMSSASNANNAGDGLLNDSSDDDEEDGGGKAAAAPKKKRKLKKLGGAKKLQSNKKKVSERTKKKKKAAVAKTDDKDETTAVKQPIVLSKKDRMELLQRKRQQRAAALTEGVEIPKKKPSGDDNTKKVSSATDKGYDSGDSYNSGGEGQLQRTKEDDDFLDIEGEDEDLVREYFQEQKFHDERGADDRGRHKDDEEDDVESEDDADKIPDNPIMAAVHRMKKLKRAELSRDEREELAKEFVDRMRAAADEDAVAVSERRPAMKKLTMLSEVQSMLAKKDMQRPLLDYDLLVVAKAWIAPLANGKLGNVTVRQRLLESISTMTGTHDGEEGVTPSDLKRSAFGKVIMSLYMHKSETPQMKRLHKSLIEQWSRPIFNKSGNMKDLERVQSERREAGVVLSYQQRNPASSRSANDDRASASAGGMAVEDINSIFKKGFKSKGAIDLGNNRVRIPYSKGFQFSVRPEHKGAETTKIKKVGRESLTKRLDVKKKAGKSAKYGNLSVEGRVAKNA